MSDGEDAPDTENETGADAATSENELEGDEDKSDQAPSFKEKIRAKLKLIIVSAVGLGVVGGGIGLYFAGVFTTENPYQVVMALPGAPVLQTLPLLTVDLKPSANRRRPFIRIVLQVELQGKSAQSVFVAKENKVLDVIQTHLRTLSVEDLAGKSGTERLRRDLIMIVQRIIAPQRVITVLYKEILVR